MAYMFYSASSFGSDLSLWDTSNVMDMSYMFYGTTLFIHKLCWDTSNVFDTSTMFDSGALSRGSGCAWQLEPFDNRQREEDRGLRDDACQQAHWRWAQRELVRSTCAP